MLRSIIRPRQILSFHALHVSPLSSGRSRSFSSIITKGSAASKWLSSRNSGLLGRGFASLRKVSPMALISRTTGPRRKVLRLLSSSSKEPVDRVKQLAAYFSPGYLRSYAMIGGASLAIYLILKTGYQTASFFSGVTIWDGLKVGFLLGCFSGAAIIVVCYFTSRSFLSLRPEMVYRGMMRALQSDPIIKKKLGTPIKPLSEFRAYTFIPGGIRTDPEERAKYQGFITRWYRPNRLQIMFTVKGPQGRGVISAEVEGSFSSPFFYVHQALDVLETEEHIVLQGREDKQVYKGRIVLR